MGVRKDVKKMVLSEAREKLRLGVKVPEVEEEEEQVGPVVAGWRGSKHFTILTLPKDPAIQDEEIQVGPTGPIKYGR